MTEKKDCRFVHLPGSENRGGRTVAYLREKDRIVVGVAYCHVNDTYNRKEGTQRAFERIKNVLQYGTNGTKDGVPVLRDAVNQKVVGIVLDGKEVIRVIIAAIRDVLGPTIIAGVSAVLVAEEGSKVLAAMESALNTNDLDSITHTAIEATLISIVSKLR